MAVRSLARPPVPADKPVTPTLQQRLTSELDAAHLAAERLCSVLSMVVDSLYRRNVDSDIGLAICLENALEVELEPARERIRATLDLVSEVPHGR